MFRKRIDPDTQFADYFEDEPRPQRQRRQPVQPAGSRRWWLGHVIGLALMMAVCLVAVRLAAGQPMFEKTLKALAAPVGLVWMLLFLVTWLSLVRRQAGLAGVSLIAWLILTIGGNSLTAKWLGDRIQQPYAAFELETAPPVECLLVLGGGTGTTPAGKAQGGGAADRVLVAARMVLSGKADRVVCSGTSSLGAAATGLTAAAEMHQLLVALQVPEEKLTKIGGRNTREELQQFAQWLEKNPTHANKPTGVVTSAWHMQRALRLANSFGVSAEAIPADFRTIHPRETPHLLIPGAANLNFCQACLFESLAAVFDR